MKPRRCGDSHSTLESPAEQQAGVGGGGWRPSDGLRRPIHPTGSRGETLFPGRGLPNDYKQTARSDSLTSAAHVVGDHTLRTQVTFEYERRSLGVAATPPKCEPEATGRRN